MGKIAVVYWSGTGNTEAMASAVAEGAKEKGAEQLEEGEFEPMFSSCEGKLGGKKIGLFGSYGWGDGEWMRTWQETCETDGAALVGPSGSGKSAIAKLIAVFWDVKDGTVSMGGVDEKKIPLEQLYDQVAFVSQDNYLFETNVRENIRMGRLSASDKEVEAAAKAAGCDAFIRSLEKGYETNVGGGGAHLSGGERQRIAIAKAMLKDAPIVILDVKYSIVLMVYGVYRVREKRRIGTSYTNRKKNVYDVTWKRIRKILKSGIGSGSFFIP